ncbi:MAG TPA: PEP/pyruvate-binding domain-containing protein [Solimonas sp.]|nr:PEP/pyruvate-binding domain-containing protein [Solimonas sp.]
MSTGTVGKDKDGAPRRLTLQRGARWSVRGRAFALLLLALLAEQAPAATTPDDATLRQWLVEMRADARGPFSGIRWYCKDGAVLDAKTPCTAHGGGVQHGEWSPRTRQLRAAGFPVANLLVNIPPESVSGPRAVPDLLPTVIVERFLMAFDDGWIFRKAQFYRGAVQDDNERDAGRAILQALVQDPAVDFVLVREAARVLPHGTDTALTARVRGMAAALDEKDPRFHALRSRIHNAPETADSQRVREYAQTARADLRDDYATLAATIDASHRPPPLAAALGGLGRAFAADGKLQQLAQQSGAAADPQQGLQSAADALVWLRDNYLHAAGAAGRLAAIDASLNAEEVAMAAASSLQPQLARANRAQRLEWLRTATAALYGLGLLNPRETTELQSAIDALRPSGLRLAEYREALEYLDRAPSWCAHRLDYTFGESIGRMSRIESLAGMYIPDRLRGSPLLFYSAVLQSLREDADRLADANHDLFGKRVSGQLRRLNPGIARGVLRTSMTTGEHGGGPAIYLVPETTADLPPAAGILTEAEGNPLSHVQILARNLGIPNVVVAQSLVPSLKAYSDRAVVIAATPGGLVQISADGPGWNRILDEAKQEQRKSVILATPAKLDLTRRDFISTAELRASQSGRLVGPKAAQVGELTHLFPEYMSPGLAVPFGIYAEILQQPVRPKGPRMFDWMKSQYAELAVQRALDPEGQQRRVEKFLAFVRDWMEHRELPLAQRERLRDAMFERFGMEGTYGVFVRSDTNVEDLPGFTGAGLNLTLPNVVRFDDVLAALRQVWASPFTERAYGWRQDLMDQPEHVYVSVLLHKSVPNDKSGVLVTADLDTGARDTLTVATNLGVGGGVDGQAAETLRVSMDSEKPQLLSSATARWQRVLPAEGGVQLVRAPAPQAVLSAPEIAQLVEFARTLPGRYPQLRDGDGKPAPADVEFGFVRGKLRLLQIRPFLQNRAAQRQQYLVKLDESLHRSDRQRVDLHQAPAEQSS